MNATSQMTPARRYRIERYLTEGGMGAIYIGKKIGQRGFEKEVVLKQLLPEYTSRPEFRDLFFREAKISATLDHANIVHTFDLVESDQSLFIVMEYVRGADLRTITRRARQRKRELSPAAAIFICTEILSGLAYAHARRDAIGRSLDIIHRDVSPSNIICSAQGEVKLSDFGIAKASTHSSVFYRVRGKVGYMSPEQARNQAIDHRCDLYSLAVCLYESLSGERLFVGDLSTPADEIYGRAVIPVSFKKPGLPAELDIVLARALAPNIDDRYQSATEFAEALRTVAHETNLGFSAPELARHLTEILGADPERWLRDDVTGSPAAVPAKAPTDGAADKPPGAGAVAAASQHAIQEGKELSSIGIVDEFDEGDPSGPMLSRNPVSGTKDADSVAQGKETTRKVRMDALGIGSDDSDATTPGANAKPSLAASPSSPSSGAATPAVSSAAAASAMSPADASTKASAAASTKAPAPQAKSIPAPLPPRSAPAPLPAAPSGKAAKKPAAARAPLRAPGMVEHPAPAAAAAPAASTESAGAAPMTPPPIWTRTSAQFPPPGDGDTARPRSSSPSLPVPVPQRATRVPAPPPIPSGARSAPPPPPKVPSGPIAVPRSTLSRDEFEDPSTPPPPVRRPSYSNLPAVGNAAAQHAQPQVVQPVPADLPPGYDIDAMLTPPPAGLPPGRPTLPGAPLPSDPPIGGDWNEQPAGVPALAQPETFNFTGPSSIVVTGSNPPGWLMIIAIIGAIVGGAVLAQRATRADVARLTGEVEAAATTGATTGAESGSTPGAAAPAPAAKDQPAP